MRGETRGVGSGKVELKRDRVRVYMNLPISCTNQPSTKLIL